LLVAQQSEDVDIMANTLKQIIKTCVQETLDIDRLALFDIEYLFTQIRAKSVGETVELIFNCQHCEQEKNNIKINIDLTQIPIIRDPLHTNKIVLFGEVGVMMKYPTLETMKLAEGKLTDINTIMQVVISCIDMIFNGDEVFYAKDQTKEELEDFVMNLTKEQFDKLENFFVSVPKFKKEIEFDCPACGAHNTNVLEGLQSFF